MFQIILTSDSPTDNYLDYDPGCFRADLSETLNLNFGQLSWEVALSELFIYPKSWHTIREPFNHYRVSISGIECEELEKRFYRCYEYETLTEETAEANVGDIRVFFGTWEYRGWRYSWSTFRGLPIFYKDFPPVPKVQNDVWVPKERWPFIGMNWQEKEFWYYRRKFPKEYRAKYPYAEFQAAIPPGTYTPEDIVSHISETAKASLNKLVLELQEDH